MSNARPTILYSEDTGPHAKVSHTISNGDVEEWFRGGKRFDAYVLDDSAVTGGGHGISLSMEIAKTLQTPKF